MFIRLVLHVLLSALQMLLHQLKYLFAFTEIFSQVRKSKKTVKLGVVQRSTDSMPKCFGGGVHIELQREMTLLASISLYR